MNKRQGAVYDKLKKIANVRFYKKESWNKIEKPILECRFQSPSGEASQVASPEMQSEQESVMKLRHVSKETQFLVSE